MTDPLIDRFLSPPLIRRNGRFIWRKGVVRCNYTVSCFIRRVTRMQQRDETASHTHTGEGEWATQNQESTLKSAELLVGLRTEIH